MLRLNNVCAEGERARPAMHAFSSGQPSYYGAGHRTRKDGQIPTGSGRAQLLCLAVNFGAEVDQAFRAFDALGSADMIQRQIQFFSRGCGDLDQQVKPTGRRVDSHNITERFQSLQYLCRSAGLNRDQSGGA